MTIPERLDYSLLPSKIVKSFDEPQKSSPVNVSFWGTNSLVLQNESVNIMIDPYFSRIDFSPFAISPVGSQKNHVQADKTAVHLFLDTININVPDAILFTHAHFDHALDLPLISSYYYSRKGKYPRVFGCESIANILIGGIASQAEITKLNSSSGKNRTSLFNELCKKYNISIVNDNSSLNVDPYQITFLKGTHAHVPFARFWLDGSISKPLGGPRNIYDYKTGEMHTIFIKDKKTRMLFIGSAGFEENEFKNLATTHGKPDYLFTAIAGLSRNREINHFVENVLQPLSPKRTYYTHWDDFDRPLDLPLDWVAMTNPESVLKKTGSTGRIMPLMKKISI